MVRLLDARRWKRRDYREGSYVHRDLSAHTRIPWHVRARLAFWNEQGADHASENDVGRSLRRRRLTIALLAVFAGWLIAQSAPGWHFFD